MRNAGDGTPGGSSGRRQRVAAAPPAARPAGNGGASLFTPAYRVRHAAVPSQAGQDRLSIGAGRAGASYGGAADQPGESAGWPRQSSSAVAYQDADSTASSDSAWDDSDPADAGYSWLVDEVSTGGWPGSSLTASSYAPKSLRNAIRGFAPIPDEPLPVYPPGPFAAWNRAAADRDQRRDSQYAAEGSPPAESGWGAPPAARDDSAPAFAVATITPDEFDTNHSLPAIKDPIRGTAAADGRPPGAGTGPLPAVTDRPGQNATRGAGSGSGRRRTSQRRGSSGSTGPDRGASKRKTKAGRGSKSRHRSVYLAIVAAVVVIAAFTAILVTTSLGGKSTNAGAKPSIPPSHPSSAPTPAPPPGVWEYIGTRKTDPTPLSLTEIYPASFAAKGSAIRATALRQSRNCHAALIGSGLQVAVKKAGCTQAMRASYVWRLDKEMATIGVFNLVSARLAEEAATHVGRSEFVTQLTSKKGVTTKIGQGTGLEEALVKGHYLVLVWAEKTDLTSPKTKWQRNRLTGFMNILIAKTVNPSLSVRMVEGKPSAAHQAS